MAFFGKEKNATDKGDTSEVDDYDPHLYRDVEHPTTNAETLIHLLKGCLGTGILAMPEAFKNAGMVNGLVFTFVIGAVCTYLLHVIVKAQYVLCKRYRVPILTFPESMKIALESGPQCLKPFAGFSAILVDFFLVVYQLGICCVYIVFVAKNVKAVIDEYTDPDFTLTQYILMTFVPFVLINCIRNLKLLAPFSTFANIITFVSFGMVCFYIFQDLPDISQVPSFGTWYTFPLYIGTTLFALEAIGVVIALENNMKTPKSFGGYFGVLNIGMGSVTVLYVAMGFFGYWRYGELTKPSITLNFPAEESLSQSIRIMYSVAIFISYGLQSYVPVEILWKSYILKHLEGKNRLILWEFSLRIASVIITFAVALSIPLFGLFISLFGAFCLSALGIAFPAIMEICVKWPDNLGPGKIILVKDIFFVIFGIMGLLAGSYSSISEIVQKLIAGELD